MSYTATQWANGVTEVSAENLNKMEARIKNLDSISNPNLLINGDFQVWQRGTSFNFPNAYTADRWFINRGKIEKATLDYKNALKITRTSADTVETNMNYRHEGLQEMRGRTYTISWKGSVNIALDYTYLIYATSGSDTINFASGTKKYTNNGINTHSITFTIPANLDAKYQVLTLRILRQCSVGDHTITIGDVKLELGESATQFVSRSYGEELDLCQRYFVPMTWSSPYWHHGFGHNAWLFIPLPNKMRVAPTLYGGSGVATNWYLCSNGVQITPTGVSVRTLASNGILLQFTGSFTAHQALIGYYNTSTLGGFDAEIY